MTHHEHYQGGDVVLLDDGQITTIVRKELGMYRTSDGGLIRPSRIAGIAPTFHRWSIEEDEVYVEGNESEMWRIIVSVVAITMIFIGILILWKIETQ